MQLGKPTAAWLGRQLEMICPQEEGLLDIGKIPKTVKEVFSCKWFQSCSLQLEALLMSGGRRRVFQDSSLVSASSWPSPPPLMAQDPPGLFKCFAASPLPLPHSGL